MQIRVQLRAVNRVLGGTILLLAGAGIVVESMRHLGGSESELVDYFSLSEECNVPTWFSSFLLLANALVLAVIAATKGSRKSEFRRHWIGLSVIFLYMSVDELVQIHEWLNSLGALKDMHGILYFSWVIPAAVAVLIFAVAYLRFLVHLPARTRFMIVAAGMIYVGGAMGVELILGAWTDVHGEDNIGYALIDVVEETMEMAGASLFLSALLEYLGTQAPDLRVAIERAATKSTHASS